PPSAPPFPYRRSSDLSAASPTVGITYTLGEPLALFANYASAYQTPTTVELSNRPDGLGGFNDELQPEYLRSLEVGIRGSHGEWRDRKSTRLNSSHVKI